MKKITLLFLSISAAFTVLAQGQTNKIVLTKNQQLKFVSAVKGNVSQEMMGQSMEIVMDVNTDRNITVKDISVQDYKLDAITTRVKMNMSMMGQDRSFDSDNKSDMAGEMKDAGKDVNVVKPLILSVNGKCKLAEKPNPEKTEQDPMSGMMQQMLGGGADEVTTENYFMLIPQGKKAGDNWSDSVVTEVSKTYWIYKWESTETNVAVIKATAKATISNNITAQGMEMTMNMNNEITEDRKVSLASGVIINKVSTVKINGTVDVMGQSVPMTGTVTTTVAAN
jgi:Family of unknown function (DUF6263)